MCHRSTHCVVVPLPLNRQLSLALFQRFKVLYDAMPPERRVKYEARGEHLRGADLTCLKQAMAELVSG